MAERGPSNGVSRWPPIIALIAFAVACTVVTVRSIGRAAGAGASAAADVRHSRALYACAGAITMVFVALPHAVGWFGFVDGRLVPVALILALLGVRREVLPRSIALGLHYGAPVVASTIGVLALVASYRFQAEAHGYKEVLARVPAGRVLLCLLGRAAALLSAERTALNFLGRLCGIATLARRCVELAAGTPARIYDTRKTTPGLRLLEKQAVSAGGAYNHRFGLFDAVLIKDNHLCLAGSAAGAVKIARDRLVFREEVLEALAEARQAQEPQLEVQRRALRHCLDELSPADQALLKRRYADSETIAELADEQGRTAKTLYRRLDRLREAIARCVERRVQLLLPGET